MVKSELIQYFDKSKEKGKVGECTDIFADEYAAEKHLLNKIFLPDTSIFVEKFYKFCFNCELFCFKGKSNRIHSH